MDYQAGECVELAVLEKRCESEGGKIKDDDKCKGSVYCKPGDDKKLVLASHDAVQESAEDTSHESSAKVVTSLAIRPTNTVVVGTTDEADDEEISFASRVGLAVLGSTIGVALAVAVTCASKKNDSETKKRQVDDNQFR